MLSRLLALIITITLSSVFSSPALANEGFSAGLGLFYFAESGTVRRSGSASVKTEHEYTFVDAFALYQINYVVLGAKYLTGTVETTTSSSGSSSKSVETENYKGFGLTLGLKGEQAMATYTYLLNPEKVYGAKLTSDLGSDTGKTTYYGKYAHMIDLAYGFKVNSFFVGPMLSLVHFEFNKVKVPGQSRTSLQPAEDADFIIPHVAFWMEF